MLALLNRTLAGFLLAAMTLSSMTALAAARHDTPVYKDPNAPLEQRVEDLLTRMTLEEKIAQITCVWYRKRAILTPAGDFDPVKAKQVFPAGIGQIARPSDLRGGGGDPYQHPYGVGRFACRPTRPCGTLLEGSAAPIEICSFRGRRESIPGGYSKNILFLMSPERAYFARVCAPTRA